MFLDTSVNVFLEPVVPCKICKTPTSMTGTKLCDNCWEVEARIDRYLKSKKGRDIIRAKLKDYPETEEET